MSLCCTPVHYRGLIVMDVLNLNLKIYKTIQKSIMNEDDLSSYNIIILVILQPT